MIVFNFSTDNNEKMVTSYLPYLSFTNLQSEKQQLFSSVKTNFLYYCVSDLLLERTDPNGSFKHETLIRFNSCSLSKFLEHNLLNLCVMH